MDRPPPSTVFRVQSLEDGRGPWRPGFSSRWADPVARTLKELEALSAIPRVDGPCPPGCAIGSGCRTLEDLRRWFTAGEAMTLAGFGFQAVRIHDAEVLAETEAQVVFLRRRPLLEAVEVVSLY